MRLLDIGGEYRFTGDVTYRTYDNKIPNIRVLEVNEDETYNIEAYDIDFKGHVCMIWSVLPSRITDRDTSHHENNSIVVGNGHTIDFLDEVGENVVEVVEFLTDVIGE